MAYSIFRIEKIKTNGQIAGRGAHNYRHNGTPNADPVKTAQNKMLVGTENVLADVQERMEKGKISTPRKDSVRAVEVVLTFSPEATQIMLTKKNQAGKLAIDVWADTCLEALRDIFGKGNLVNACLHLDERTPHIHAFVIPEHKGRLNCSHFTKGKKKMHELQNQFHKAIEPSFGAILKRGKAWGDRKHKSLKEILNQGDSNLAATNIALRQNNEKLRDDIAKLKQHRINKVSTLTRANKQLREILETKETRINTLHSEINTLKAKLAPAPAIALPSPRPTKG